MLLHAFSSRARLTRDAHVRASVTATLGLFRRSGRYFDERKLQARKFWDRSFHMFITAIA